MDASAVQTRKRLSGYQILLLWLMAALILGLYGVLVLVVFGGKEDSSTEPRSMGGGSRLELQVAHTQALGAAQNWRPDAQLVGVTTSWQLAGGDRLTMGRPAWSFSFYSPAAHQIQIVTVDHDGTQTSRVVSVHGAPAVVTADWSLDSDELLLTFLAHGGEDFLSKHDKANVHFQLKQEQDERSVWYLTALDPVARESVTVSVDAVSRQVISA